MQDKAQEFIQQLWANGLDKRLPVIITFLAILMLTHSMASLTWRIMPQPEIIDEGLTVLNSPARVAIPSPRADVPSANVIARWNLFGKVEINKPKPKIEQDIELAPPTKLNLKLKGLFYSDNKNNARAIIADAKQKEDSYAIGDDVPGGAKVHDILKTKVILEHNGKLETLELPQDIPLTAVANANNRRASRNNSRSSAAPPINSTIGDNGELLKQYRDALVSNPQSVMGLISARPYSKDGRLVGYRIKPGKDRHLLRRFGLRSGDVVTAVNGVPMNNPIKALEVLRDLSTATSLSVDIERNGTPQSFSFPINE